MPIHYDATRTPFFINALILEPFWFGRWFHSGDAERPGIPPGNALAAQQAEEIADFSVELGFVGDGAADFVAQDGAKFAAHFEGGLFHGAFADAESGGDLQILCSVLSGEDAAELEELRFASAGFESFVKSGQGIVIDGAGPAAVEGFLRCDVGGERHGSGGFEFCEGERGDAVPALLCGGGAVLINAPALQRGEKEGAEEAVSPFDPLEEVTAEHVCEEPLDVIRGGVVVCAAAAEKGVERLPVGAGEALPSGEGFAVGPALHLVHHGPCGGGKRAAAGGSGFRGCRRRSVL